jgi:hypothetical protein
VGVGLTGLGRATRAEDEMKDKRGEAMYALARELGQRLLQVANIPEAIGFCRGRTDSEARLIASSESVSRLYKDIC